MKLPKDLRALLKERGHVRNLVKLLPEKWPEVQKVFTASGLSIAEFMFLGLGNKQGYCACGKPTRFLNFVDGYKATCPRTCEVSKRLFKERKEKTLIERYGVTHQMRVPEVKQAVWDTMQARYGAKTTLQSKELKAKVRKTNQDRYGANTFMVSDEGRQYLSTIAKTTQKQREKTMQQRYGVNSPMQIPEVQLRQQETSMLFKTVKIGRKEFRVRGYEGLALTYLHEEKGVPVKAMRVAADHELPTVKYEHAGKARWYFPDIMLVKPKRKVLIEVKSIYTIARTREQGERVLAKFKAASKNHEFWLMLIHKKQVILIKDPGRFTVSNLLARVDVKPAYA